MTLTESADPGAASRDIEACLVPASPRERAAYAAFLMKDTKRRAASPAEDDQLLDRFVDVLGDFPADVAAEVCLTWHRRGGAEGVFTPAPAELFEACRKKTAPRRLMLRRLQLQGRTEVLSASIGNRESRQPVLF